VLSLVAGTFDMAANVLYLLAVREGMLSLVAVIASLYPAATVALAAGVDGERVSRPQLIGLMVAAAALVMVTLSRS
jgi:drug/metabolite transporter (DMT)-like permease